MDISHLTLPSNVKLLHDVDIAEISKQIHSVNNLNQTPQERIVYIEVPKKPRNVYTVKDFDNHVLLTSSRVLQVCNGSLMHAIPYSRLQNVSVSLKKTFFGRNKVTCELKPPNGPQTVVKNGKEDDSSCTVEIYSNEKLVLQWLVEALEYIQGIITEGLLRGETTVLSLTHRSLPSILPQPVKEFKIGITYPMISTAYFIDLIEYALVEKLEKFFVDVPESRMEGMLSKLLFKPTVSVYSTQTPNTQAKFNWVNKRTEEVPLPGWVHTDTEFNSSQIANFSQYLECRVTPLNAEAELTSELRVMFTMRVMAPESVVTQLLSLGDSDDEETMESRNEQKKSQGGMAELCVVSMNVGSLQVDLSVLEIAPFLEVELVCPESTAKGNVTAHNAFLHSLRAALKPLMTYVVDQQGFDFGKLGSLVAVPPLLLLINEPQLIEVGQSIESVQALASTGLKFHGSLEPGVERQQVIMDHVPEVEATEEDLARNAISPTSKTGVGKTILNGFGAALSFFGEVLSKLPQIGGPAEFVEEKEDDKIAYIDDLPPYMRNASEALVSTEVVTLDLSMIHAAQPESSAVWDQVYEFQVITSSGWVNLDPKRQYWQDDQATIVSNARSEVMNPLWEYRAPWRVPLTQEAFQVIAAAILKEETVKAEKEMEAKKEKKMVKKKNILLRGILGQGNKLNGAADEIVRGILSRPRDARYKAPDLRMVKESFGYVVSEDTDFLTWEYSGSTDQSPIVAQLNKSGNHNLVVSELKTQWHYYYRPGDIVRRRMHVRPRRYLSAHNPVCDCEFCWLLTTVCQEDQLSFRERSPFGELMKTKQVDFFITCVDFIAQELRSAQSLIRQLQYEKLLASVDWQTLVAKVRCQENVLEHGRMFQHRTVMETGMLVSWIPQNVERQGDEIKELVFSTALVALGWYFPLLKPAVIQDCMQKGIGPDEYVNAAQSLYNEEQHKLDMKSLKISMIHNNAAVLMQVQEGYAAVDRAALNKAERLREEAEQQGYTEEDDIFDSNSNDAQKDVILHTIGCPYMYRAGEELRLPQQDYQFSEDLVQFPRSTLASVPASVARSLRVQQFLVCSLQQDYDVLFHPLNIALPPALPPASVYAECSNLVHAQDPTAEYSPTLPVCSLSCARATLASVQQQLHQIRVDPAKSPKNWLFERKVSGKLIPGNLDWRNGSLEAFLEEFPRRIAWLKRLIPVLDFVNQMNVLPKSWNLSSIIFRSVAYIDQSHVACAFAAGNIVMPAYFKNPSAALAQHPLYRHPVLSNASKQASTIVTQHPNLAVKASYIIAKNPTNMSDMDVREVMPYILHYGRTEMDETRTPTWNVPFVSPLVQSNQGGMVYNHPCVVASTHIPCSKQHCEYHDGGKQVNASQVLAHLQQPVPSLQTILNMFQTALETQSEMKKKYSWQVSDAMKPSQRFLWNITVDNFTPYQHQRLLSAQLKSSVATAHSLDLGYRQVIWVARLRLISTIENSIREICEREVVYVTGQSLHTSYLAAWDQLGPLHPDQPWGRHPLQSVLPPALLAPNTSETIMYPALYNPFLKVLRSMGVPLPFDDPNVLQDCVETFAMNNLNSATPYHGTSPFSIQNDLSIDTNALALNSVFQLFAQVKQNTLILATLSRHYRSHVPRFAADCVLLISAYMSHLLHLLSTPLVQPQPAMSVKSMLPKTSPEDPTTKNKIRKFFANDAPVIPVETWWHVTDSSERVRPSLKDVRQFTLDMDVTQSPQSQVEGFNDVFPKSVYRSSILVGTPLSPAFDLGAYTHSLTHHYSVRSIDQELEAALQEYALQGRSLSSQMGQVMKTSTKVDNDGTEVIHKYAAIEELRFPGHSCSVMETYSWSAALSVAVTAMRASELMCEYLSFIEQHCGGGDVFLHLLAYDKMEHQTLNWVVHDGTGRSVVVGDDHKNDDPVLAQGEYALQTSSRAIQTAINVQLTHLAPAVSAAMASGVVAYRQSHFGGTTSTHNTTDWKLKFTAFMRGESSFDPMQSGYNPLDGHRTRILVVKKGEVVKKRHTPSLAARKSPVDEDEDGILTLEDMVSKDNKVTEHMEGEDAEQDEDEDSDPENEEDQLAYYMQIAGMSESTPDTVTNTNSASSTNQSSHPASNQASNQSSNPFDDDDGDDYDFANIPHTSTNPFDDDAMASTNPFGDHYVNTNPFDDDFDEPHQIPDEEDTSLDTFQADLIVNEPVAPKRRTTIQERLSVSKAAAEAPVVSLPSSSGLSEQYPVFQLDSVPTVKEPYIMHHIPFPPSEDIAVLVRVFLGVGRADSVEALPLSPSLTTLLFLTEQYAVLGRSSLTKFFSHVLAPALTTAVHTATKDVVLKLIPSPVLMDGLPPLLTRKDIQTLYACIPVPLRSLTLASTLPQHVLSNIAAMYALSAFFSTNSPDTVPPLLLLPRTTKPTQGFINDYAQTLIASADPTIPFSFPLTKLQARAQDKVYAELLRLFFPLEFALRVSPYITYVATQIEQCLREDISLSQLYDTPAMLHTWLEDTDEESQDLHSACKCMVCTEDIPPITEHITPELVKKHLQWLFVLLNKAGISHTTLQWVARISKVPASTCTLLASLYAPSTPNYKRYSLIEF